MADDLNHTHSYALDDLMTEHQLSRRWQNSTRTLQRWRSEGFGPAHILIGGSVRYRFADVLAFEDCHRKGGEV